MILWDLVYEKIQLTGTRDLVRWKRLGQRVPILDLGESHQWDSGTTYPCNRPMIVGNEIWWYYCGCNHGQATDSETTGSIGLAEQAIRRHCEMTRAKLFSFRFVD